MYKIINIGRLPVISICIFLLIIIVSCSKQKDNNNISEDISQLIRINGDRNEVVTKTTLSGLVTSWVESTDKVGVYCAEAQEAGGRVNVEYSASSSAASSAFTGNMKWGTGNHNFYAYYPRTAGSAAASVVPISLSASQTQTSSGSSSHIGALDFMVATPMTNVTPGTSGNSTTVNLHYNHVFAILEFKIYSASGSGKITKLKLTAPSGNLSLTSGTIDITQATPATGSSYTIASQTGTTSVTLTITGGATVGTTLENTSSIFMMILPGDHSSQDMTIGIETDNQGYYTDYIKTGKAFLRGKKYVVALDLDNSNPWGSLSPVTINHVSTAAVNGVAPATGSITWAPVNAGYDATHPYGLLYQWGRKYGQASRASETPSSSLVSAQVTISDGNLASNANNFYYSSSKNNWCSNPASTPVWDMTLYNPCPAGWTVPTRAQVAALVNIALEWVDSGYGGLCGRWYGLTAGSNQLFVPGGGDRINDGSYIENGIHSDIWTIDTFGSSGKAHCYDDYKPGSGKPTAFDSDDMIRGNSVRCVKK